MKKQNELKVFLVDLGSLESFTKKSSRKDGEFAMLFLVLFFFHGRPSQPSLQCSHLQSASESGTETDLLGCFISLYVRFIPTQPPVLTSNLVANVVGLR